MWEGRGGSERDLGVGEGCWKIEGSEGEGGYLFVLLSLEFCPCRRERQSSETILTQPIKWGEVGGEGMSGVEKNRKSREITNVVVTVLSKGSK